jgi:hypothetical protein
LQLFGLALQEGVRLLGDEPAEQTDVLVAQLAQREAKKLLEQSGAVQRKVQVQRRM